MGEFIIYLTTKARKDLSKHKRTGNKASERKIKKILEELKIHPETGIGKPEKLKNDLQGYWSRRINRKDRLIYKIKDSDAIVDVLSAMGHYFDK